MSKSNALSTALATLFICGCSASPQSTSGSGGAVSASTGGQVSSTSTQIGGGTSGGGNATGVGGHTNGGNGMSATTGGAAASNAGASSTGGTAASSTAGGVATGGTKNAGGVSGSGGASGTGGSVSAGGATSTPAGGGPAGGSAAAGGIATSSTGGTINTGGAANTGGSTCTPPPKQCGNQDYVQNCITGNATTPCGGNCVSFANACVASDATKGATATAFACPQWMLFSDAMNQAAILDGNTAFNYAVVGHDVDNNGGIDGTAQSSCCQCYQLVFDYPSPTMDNEALLDPNDPSNPQSGIPIPPPLIVQSFNTGTNGPDDFDVFMAAGGFGGNNACDPNDTSMHNALAYFYTSFPADSSGQGTVKPAANYSQCKTSLNWVTNDSLSTPACETAIKTECDQFAASSAEITAESINSCIASNSPNTFYHLNWYVHAMKVECPSHLTDVTGCKLAPQGLPAANPNVTTAAQAAASPSFKATAGNGNHFSTTTMQDCCKPSCASQNWVSGKGLTPVGLYNSFYSCDQSGNPITEASCN